MSRTLQGKTATIFGGTGFVGRYIVACLARAGMTVRVVTRHKQSAYFLRTNGIVGQIVPVSSAYRSADEVDRAVAGSDVVINCLGTLKSNRFTRLHRDIPEWIAQSCARHNVEALVHLSALTGGAAAQSDYAKSKLAGEQAVQAAFPAATILRPSVIFGPEDRFFNLFAGLSRFAPALPLIGGGKMKFPPVYVGDVAAAAVTALMQPDIAQGKIFELGGPEILTLREVYQRIFSYSQKRRALLPLPWGLSSLVASLPLMPLTCDQVKSLRSDTVVSNDALTLAQLGIQPAALDSVLPSYLKQYRPGGRFADKKRA